MVKSQFELRIPAISLSKAKQHISRFETIWEILFTPIRVLMYRLPCIMLEFYGEFDFLTKTEFIYGYVI